MNFFNNFRFQIWRGHSQLKIPKMKKANADSATELAKETNSKFDIDWSTQGTVIYGIPGPLKGKTAEKLAAFDMDSTLITTKSGKRFPKDANDFRLLFPIESKKKLKELQASGFTCAIFTNQGGISKGHTTASAIQKKIQAISSELETPFIALMSTMDDWNHKPSPGMWEIFVSKVNGGKEPEKKGESFFCGDAAGRPERGPKKKDFSDGD